MFLRASGKPENHSPIARGQFQLTSVLQVCQLCRAFADHRIQQANLSSSTLWMLMGGAMCFPCRSHHHELTGMGPGGDFRRLSHIRLNPRHQFDV